MACILVIYHTQSGNMQKLAEAVVAGAASDETCERCHDWRPYLM